MTKIVIFSDLNLIFNAEDIFHIKMYLNRVIYIFFIINIVKFILFICKYFFLIIKTKKFFEITSLIYTQFIISA